MVNRDWEDEYKGNMDRGYAPGATINIKKPPRYTYRAGRVAQLQATTETTIPLTVTQGGCDLDFTSFEGTLSMTKLEDKLMAAMAEVVNEIDRQGLALAHYATYNMINPTGALPTTAANSIAAMTDMGRRLDEMSAPRDRRRFVCSNPALNGALVQGFGGFFNRVDTVSEQNRTGLLADNNFGFNTVGMDQNVDSHTNGTQNVAGVNISGANQTGASINIAALTGTVTRGTIINLPGVNATNVKTRMTTGVAMDFVVTADLAAGATSIPISPAIVVSGAFQNVTASPTNGSPFTIRGAASTSYGCSVAAHKDAFTLAMVPMYTPEAGTGVKCTQMEDNGFRVMVTKGHDIMNQANIMRLDVLFGWAAPYPELSAKYYNV